MPPILRATLALLLALPPAMLLPSLALASPPTIQSGPYSLLYGYDGASLLWRGLAVDPNGNLGVNLSGTASGTVLPTGGATGIATASPTVSTSAYSAGYDVGGLITLTGLVRSGATSGMVQSVLANFADAQPNAQLYGVLFNSSPASSTITDHTAVAIAAADQGKIIGVVPLTYCQQTGTPTTCEATQLAMSYAGAASGGPLYLALVTQSTITLGSTSDLKITVTGPQD